MDNFSIFYSSFGVCLANLSTVLKRCVKVNLVYGIEAVLLIDNLMEVVKSNVDLISNMLAPVEQVRSFHFHRKFIKDCNKVVRPFTN